MNPKRHATASKELRILLLLLQQQGIRDCLPRKDAIMAHRSSLSLRYNLMGGLETLSLLSALMRRSASQIGTCPRHKSPSNPRHFGSALWHLVLLEGLSARACAIWLAIDRYALNLQDLCCLLCSLPGPTKL